MIKVFNKITFILFFVFIASCSTKQELLPAEDALDAVRLFKDAYQNGDFEKAKFYCLIDASNQVKLDSIFKRYEQLSNSEKTQLKTESIIILNNKNIDENNVQIIVSNKPMASIDTFHVTKQKEFWLIQLSK